MSRTKNPAPAMVVIRCVRTTYNEKLYRFTVHAAANHKITAHDGAANMNSKNSLLRSIASTMRTFGGKKCLILDKTATRYRPHGHGEFFWLHATAKAFKRSKYTGNAKPELY